jgi:hypothetical protein
MAKKVPSAAKGRERDMDSVSYSPYDLDKMEKLTLEKANKCISAIENAIAVWELAKDKPEDMESQISRMKNFYEALTSWEKKMLKSMGKKGKIKNRVDRLKEFISICYAYA